MKLTPGAIVGHNGSGQQEPRPQLSRSRHGVQRGSGCMFQSDRAERCRLKAEECRELAKRARDPETRAQLLALVEQWLALAKDIEKAETRH